MNISSEFEFDLRDDDVLMFDDMITAARDPIIHAVYRDNDIGSVIQTIGKNLDDINKISEDEGSTPLHLACSIGGLDHVKALLGHGADLFKEDCGGSLPINVACRDGRLDIVKYLLGAVEEKDRKYMLNKCGQFGENALHSAVHSTDWSPKRYTLVKELLEAGARPCLNSFGQFPSDYCDKKVKELLKPYEDEYVQVLSMEMMKNEEPESTTSISQNCCQSL